MGPSIPTPSGRGAAAIPRTWGNRRMSARAAAIRSSLASKPLVDESAVMSSAMRQESIARFHQVGVDIGGLTAVQDAPLPGPETQELAIEIEFSGFRSGKLTMGIGRGLSRQLAISMQQRDGEEARPINAVEAVKSFASLLLSSLLAGLYGLEAHFRMGSPQAMPPRPLQGTLVLALGAKEGTLSIALEVGHTPRTDS
jgi:hypothetical protein